MKDVYVISYSDRWAWKFKTGVVQKLCKTKEEAVFYAEQQSRKYESDLYVEGKSGKFIKQRLSGKP